MTEDTAYLTAALREARAEVARLTVEHRHQREVIGQQSARLMDQAATLAAVRTAITHYDDEHMWDCRCCRSVRNALDGTP